MTPILSHTAFRHGLNFSLLLASALVSVAHAQQIYRYTGPDGRLVFSDRPPAPSVQTDVIHTGGPTAGTSNTVGLPFELQQVARKYPVVLYTGPNCSPCDAARSMLVGRGIPFAEKKVESREDQVEFQKIISESVLPSVSIGPQKQVGYNEALWNQLLTAAAYPQTSQLPRNYRYAPAAPLVEPLPPAPAPAAAASAPAPAAPAANAPANPSGIRF